ncbi:MAG: hypothetical protein ACUZ77_05100 [Candidatus Brocadiales bacterium]
MRNRIMYLGIAVLSLCLLLSSTGTAQDSGQETELGINIEHIESDEFISGRVFGIEDAAQYSQYKVVVYVKTDKWYIHPYAGGGAGKSFAEIKRDGTWEIFTVRREFRASKVAAFLVKKDKVKEPPTTMISILSIDCEARFIKDVSKGDWKL